MESLWSSTQEAEQCPSVWAADLLRGCGACGMRAIQKAFPVSRGPTLALREGR